MKYRNKKYPHIEKNSPVGYFFVSDRDFRLYRLFRDGASPVVLLEMPEAETMSGGNLYRILNRVEWIERHAVPFISPSRYDTEKRHGWLYEVRAARSAIPKNFFQEAAIPHYLKHDLELIKP